MKDTPYFGIFADAYNLMKTHYPVVGTDAYWDGLLDEANSICERHQASEFCKAMIVAVLKELERRYKDEKEIQTKETAS